MTKRDTYTALLTTTTTTNILNPADAGTGNVGYTPTASVITIKHMRAINKTGSSATVSLWRSTTGDNTAGKEFGFNAATVAANASLDWYGNGVFTAADFLVGGASANSTITLEIEFEVDLA